MYLNVISFTNSLKIPFTTKAPYSVDKVADGWNLVTDEDNGQVLSFKGSEIVTIASQDLERNTGYTPRHARKVKTEISSE